jgi:hypothetical protein
VVIRRFRELIPAVPRRVWVVGQVTAECAGTHGVPQRLAGKISNGSAPADAAGIAVKNGTHRKPISSREYAMATSRAVPDLDHAARCEPTWHLSRSAVSRRPGVARWAGPRSLA